MKLFIFLTSLWLSSIACSEVKPLISTYLGDKQRNFYGNVAPSKLNVKWKTGLGTGATMLGKERKVWSGAGWTGQPIIVKENNELYLIQPSLSHHLRKIRARDGKVIWSTNLGDSIKATPTFVTTSNKDPEKKFIIICGSRRGLKANFFRDPAYSLHAVSYLTGKKLWQFNSLRSYSHSRDIDASGIMVGNKFCIPTETGTLTYLNPNPNKAKFNKITGIAEPFIHKKFPLFSLEDTHIYKHEISCESSPTVYKSTIYTATGAGKIYAHSTGLFSKQKWIFQTGGDINGSMPLTSDNQFLVGVEKQFMPGNGGVMKIKPKGKVSWYFPLPNKQWYEWQGGIVGSPSVNHRTAGKNSDSNTSGDLACFAGIDGSLTLINHKKLTPNKTVWGPLHKNSYATPLILDQVKLPEGTISTPLFIDNKIIIGYDSGIDLYLVTPKNKLELLDRLKGPMFDATPAVWNGKIYAASKDGFLYCLGD